MKQTTTKELTPQEYFNTIKALKHIVTDEQLVKVYDNCLELIGKYTITGQTKALKKLKFHLQCIEKEREIVKLGVNTFVYKDDIEYYIDNVASDVVKIIDLPSYERELPDEIIDVIERVGDKFDNLYIVFTDYAGKTERKVTKERREKDPILFGTFQDISSQSIIDRFYYLGDWVDEYCDLTLDKMISEVERVGKRKISHSIKTPEDIDELKAQLKSLDENTDAKWQNNFIVKTEPDYSKSDNTFNRVKTFLKNIIS